MRSIMQRNRGCYVCGDNNYLESHHIFYGNRNRNKAEKDGLKVFLCYEHHRGTYGIHGREGHELDTKLKQDAERTWLKHYNKTIDDFIDRYGRNYLDADIND
jgi:hypothetical protein